MMGIYAPQGTKIRYAHERAGTLYDQKQARAHLDPRVTYTVIRTEGRGGVT
jgi:hypothetical protein